MDLQNALDSAKILSFSREFRSRRISVIARIGNAESWQSKNQMRFNESRKAIQKKK
ncbi:hypothetical protein [Helicobacter sp. 23-1045]